MTDRLDRVEGLLETLSSRQIATQTQLDLLTAAQVTTQNQLDLVAVNQAATQNQLGLLASYLPFLVYQPLFLLVAGLIVTHTVPVSILCCRLESGLPRWLFRRKNFTQPIKSWKLFLN